MQRQLLAIIDNAVRQKRHLTADEVLARGRALRLNPQPEAAAIIHRIVTAVT